MINCSLYSAKVDFYFASGIQVSQEYYNTSNPNFKIISLSTPCLTQRSTLSDIAKTFDVLGWVSPAIIKSKIFLQRLWEEKVDWDDPIPSATREAWSQ